MPFNDRPLLIRFASTLPKGSEERRAILAGLRQNSPEGLGEYDLSFIPDIEHHGFLKRDATPLEVAQHYAEQAQAVLKSK